jgi:3',5'-cyclic AMP phosphodiesterase CpdA
MKLHGSRWIFVAATVLVACGGDDADVGGTTGTGTNDESSSTGLPTTSTTTADTTIEPTTADSSGSSGSTGEIDYPDPLPPLDAAPLTTDVRLAPLHAVEPDPIGDPRVPAELDQLVADGYGDEEEIDGEPIIDVTLDGSDPPDSGANAARVTRFVHLADTQIPDDESPTRLLAFDSDGATAGAFRPQEAYACNITNAAVRTINAVNAEDAVDFVVLGGDNADSAQTNEVQWYLDIMDGAPVVHCDSGIDDDPVPGEANDPKDPFAPVGLDVPWYWVMGNHDVLVQGNFAIAGREDDALGVDVAGATRDWSMPGGPQTVGPVEPDEQRALLDGPSVLAMIAASGDGHGIDQPTIDSGKANYTFDVADTDIRFIILDTAGQTGGAEGLVREGEVDAFLRPALDAAVDDGMRVLVATHHASGSLGDGGGLGGMEQPDALSTADFQALLGEYDNIVAHLCGHSHVHQVIAIEPTGGNAYWEIITSAIADHPHQMRILEIRDEDNGFLSMSSIALDVSFDGDDLGAEGRLRSITDMTSGWQPTGEGVPEDRNVRVWIPTE